MTINVAAGAAAYANAAKTLASPQGAAATAEGNGFGDMLKSALNGVIGDQQKGEIASMQAAAGTGDLNSVVAAVTNADVSLQTVVAVRDKVISAYQEILHMTV